MEESKKSERVSGNLYETKKGKNKNGKSYFKDKIILTLEWHRKVLCKNPSLPNERKKTNLWIVECVQTSKKPLMFVIHKADFGFMAFRDVADISTFDVGGFGTSGTIFSETDRCATSLTV